MQRLLKDMPAASNGLPSVASAETYVIEVVERIDARWDAVVSNFADVCLEQSASYMLPRWGAQRLCGLLVRDAVTLEPEAAALVVLAALPLVKLGLAYVKFGPLWRSRTHAPRPPVLSVALDALKQQFVQARGLLLRVMPPADPEFGKEWQDAVANTKFARARPVGEPDRYFVNLALSEQEQLASLGAKWRANLRKAHGLDVREVDPQTMLPTFLDLYGAMTDRKQFVDRHKIDLIQPFIAATQSLSQVRMFFASSDGVPVAGSIIAGAGDCVSVPFSASNKNALTLRAGFALRWEIINRLRGGPAKWLDLGGDEGDSGLRHFKVGNVGTRGRIVALPGEYDYVESHLSKAATIAIGWAHHLGQLRSSRRAT
jgi:hypothetical protein